MEKDGAEALFGDVYVCGECDKFFAVEEGVEPNNCPVCGSLFWEFSQEVALIPLNKTGIENDQEKALEKEQLQVSFGW